MHFRDQFPSCPLKFRDFPPFYLQILHDQVQMYGYYVQAFHGMIFQSSERGSRKCLLCQGWRLNLSCLNLSCRCNRVRESSAGRELYFHKWDAYRYLTAFLSRSLEFAISVSPREYLRLKFRYLSRWYPTPSASWRESVYVNAYQ